MGLFDKFMSSMNMDDDDEYYDDYDDEEYDDDYEDDEPARGGFFGGLIGKKRDRDYDDDYDDFEELPAKKGGSKSLPAVTNNKVTAMPPRNNRRSGMEVVVIKPTSMDDARELADTLLNGKTVVLNMEGLDMDIAQRIIDFASGACYALSGNLQKIANYIFIITPATVDISGDFQNLLSGALGGGVSSSFNTPSF